MRKRKKEENNFKAYFIIFIIVLILVVLILATTITSLKKYGGNNNSSNNNTSLNNNSSIKLEFGKYNISKVAEETGDVDESYFNDLSFDFKDNGSIKIYDIQGKYLEGTFSLEEDSIVCNAKKIYYYEYNEDGKKLTNTDVNIKYTLKQVDNKTLKINSIDYNGEIEFDLFNVVGNEYTIQ